MLGHAPIAGAPIASTGRVGNTVPVVQPRKWRVKTDSVMNHGRNCVVAAEVQLFNARGGPDLVPTQTGYSAQLIYGNDGYDNAWHAFDDNAGTLWHDSCSLGGVDYIGWDFQTPTDVIGFSWRARGDSYGAQDSIETGGLEYWDEDTSSWVRRFSIATQTGWNGGDYRAFFDPSTAVADDGGYRFWEIKGTASAATDYNGMSRVELARDTGGNLVDNSYVSIITSGSVQGGSAPSIIDYTAVGLVQWYGGADGSHWFAVDFGQNNGKKIGRVTLLGDRDAVGRSWSSFEVAAYNNPDRSDRTVIQSFTTTWMDGVEQTFTLNSYGVTAAVGSAVGTSTANGVYIPQGTGDGHAAGTSTAAASGIALGTISLQGSALALGVATGMSDPIRARGGIAIATSTAIGIGAAVGTISGVGNADGTSTVDSGSRATGIIQGDGAAAGAGAGAGVGTGRLDSGGSAAGTSAADAGGSYRPTPGVGSASGVGAAAANATVFVPFVGAASVLGQAAGIIAGVQSGVGAASGQGSTTGVSNQTLVMVGASAATSNVAGVGTGRFDAAGAAASISSAAATSAALAPMRGSAAATSSTTASAVMIAARGAAAAAQGTATAVGRLTSAGVGAATAGSSATGGLRALSPALGSSNGGSTATGVGRVATGSVGRSGSLSLATAYGVRVDPGVDDEEIVTVGLDGWLIQVEGPDDGIVVVAADDAIVIVPFDDAALLAA